MKNAFLVSLALLGQMGLAGELVPPPPALLSVPQTVCTADNGTTLQAFHLGQASEGQQHGLVFVKQSKSSPLGQLFVGSYSSHTDYLATGATKTTQTYLLQDEDENPASLTVFSSYDTNQYCGRDGCHFSYTTATLKSNAMNETTFQCGSF
ncbi:MAG: hypothetical protein AB7F86_19965 [Bdellovibrionales bacterium]